MRRTMCKSKIHRAVVTEADLNYVGSVTVDPVLMEAADLIPYEKVQIVDINNGNRMETYVIEGEKGTGEICINGAAARLVQPGDLVILMSYAEYSDEELKHFSPRVVFVNERNEIARVDRTERAGQIG